jgi:ABC-type uncharacterized transport system YnjBCD ATPase subunit
MANLTIAVDDELLREARIKAVQQGTSVNEICREAIERFTRDAADDAQARIARLLALASKPRNIPAGEPAWKWPGREAFYDEVLRERGLIKDEPPR